MPADQLHAVTGAFGYSGRYIAQQLLDRGYAVRTLTNSLHRPNPFGPRVQAFPLSFDDPAALTAALRGVAVLYNTYWVRFNYRRAFTHAQAVRNTRVLFDAAKAAGVRRIVHVSITNPSEDSPLEYFRGKAQLERALRESGIAHSILRPAVLFGGDDILINNIAWMLRKLPIFGVFGDGRYRLQPIHVEDLARLAADEGEVAGERIINAIGPETFTYRQLVACIGSAIGKPRPIVPVPVWLGYAMARALGYVTGDVVLTRAEIRGLMDDLLYVKDATPPAAATTRLSAWAREHADALGRHYASELARRASVTRTGLPGGAASAAL